MRFVMPAKPETNSQLLERWNEFLNKVEGCLSDPIQLHCLGGFVLTACYGLPRATGDLDYISVVPAAGAEALEAIAGRNSKLAKKYGLYFQYVTVADVPENYEERLVEIFRGRFSHLHLFALEVHDLVLAKLVRNHPVDLEDVKFLAKVGFLNQKTLRERYKGELRPNLSNQERHDLTLELWIEACFQT